MKKLFEKQLILYLLLGSLLFLVYIASGFKSMMDGQFLGIASKTWFLVSLAAAFVHHTYVWFCWRTQLHFKLITNLMPRIGFHVYAVGFFVLFVARFLSVLFIAISNRSSTGINPFILYVPALLCAALAVYTFYSVFKYFGLLRATGQDHFDESYRNKPFENRGMFKYSKNAMYTYGLLIMIVPGLLFNSPVGILVGLFNYIYAWIHYYTLELPDIKRIYGQHN